MTSHTISRSREITWMSVKGKCLVLPTKTVFEGMFGLQAGEWAHQKVEANRGDTLLYVARESEGDDFDLYIVPEENVTRDAFWTDYVLLKKTNKAYYRGYYTFKTDGVFFLVVSNDRAKSLEREIYVKMELNSAKNTTVASKFDSQKENALAQSIQFIQSWKLPIALILSTIILSMVVYFVIPGLAYVVTFGGGALLTLYYVHRAEQQKSN